MASSTDTANEFGKLKVVLVHDWLTGMRGGERVLEALCRLFPEAPIFTLVSKPAALSAGITAHPITASWLRRIPRIAEHYRYFLPLFPRAIESLKLPDADLVISTSHCVAKGVRPPPGAKHLCYCFTPMRYAWTFYEEYFGRNPLKKMLVAPLLARLRAWDRTSCSRVTRFVTLSRHVRERIRACYDTEADVVYPPVDPAFWTPDPAQPASERKGKALGDFYLIVSALVPYKRLDLAVRAFSRTNRPLVIVGVGTELETLKKMARPSVLFPGHLSDEEVRTHYRRCRALIFPGEEDFGLVPVEVQACGRPVIALARGGVLESVRENVTGLFFKEQTEDALLKAVETFESRRWNPAVIRKNAESFSPDRFIAGLTQSLRRCLGTDKT